MISGRRETGGLRRRRILDRSGRSANGGSVRRLGESRERLSEDGKRLGGRGIRRDDRDGRLGGRLDLVGRTVGRGRTRGKTLTHLVSEGGEAIGNVCVNVCRPGHGRTHAPPRREVRRADGDGITRPARGTVERARR